MEVFSFHHHRTFFTKPHSMNPIFSKFHSTLRLLVPNFFRFSASPISQATDHAICESECKKTLRRCRPKVKTKASVDAQLKADWLRSLTHPFLENPTLSCDGDNTAQHSNAAQEWVLGIDPDMAGAVAVLKPDGSGYSAEVFDSPHLKVLVGKRTRRRLDANSIVQLILSFEAPLGTTAYIEQSIPYPKDGKQGWWSGGFGYGLWIGVLVASGFSIVPVSSLMWKKKLKLAGNHLNKDDSRELASTLFPSVTSLLKRKKDHGRAEALLIAAYGKGLKMNSDSCISEEYTTKSLLAVAEST